VAGLRVALVESHVASYRVPFLGALQERADELTVFGCRMAEGVEARLRDLDVQVRRLPHVLLPRRRRHPYGFSMPESIEVPVRIRHELLANQPDVVISGDLGLRSVQCASYRRETGAPLVLWTRLSEHSELARGPLRRAIRERLVRSADSLVVNGASGSAYLRSIGADPVRIAVVPQALNPEAVAHERISAHGGPTRLLFVGKVVSGKGLHQLLTACRSLPAGTWTLTIVGDGDERGRLENECTSWNLPVTFTGGQTPPQVAAHLARSDYLVHPSLSDEWALVVGEALASGVPVLGSVLADAVNELVTDGENGWKLDPTDVRQMRSVVAKAIAVDDLRRQRMSAAARSSALRLHPDAVADTFFSALELACARSGPPVNPPRAQHLATG